MERIFRYENGTIYVSSGDLADHKTLHKVTINFLKSVIKERIENGNCDPTTNIRKK